VIPDPEAGDIVPASR